MRSENFNIDKSFDDIFAVIEELNSEIEQLPDNVKTVPLFLPLNRLYTKIKFLKDNLKNED